MQRARAFERNRKSGPDRGADGVAPRSTPLTLVRGAVAGDDLRSVAGTAARELGCPVAIAIPALGEPVVSPDGSLGSEAVGALHALAVTAVEGDGADSEDMVLIRIGEQTLGIVAVVEPGGGGMTTERRAWLEAAAAAASVTALITIDRQAALEDSADALLEELAAGPPGDLPAFLARARRLGVELEAGAVAICARTKTGNPPDCDRLIAAHDPGALLAPLGRRWMVGVVALAGHERADEIAAALQSHGMTVALSAPRRDPGSLHEAFREAQLLVDLEGAPDVQLAGQDETYRLLIGILLRDPDELVTLRERTISSLVDYDARHDTDLLETLKAFLDHDGSTTETADAMQLHRHTVGYRLSRVHGVSGLSPYESDGRERLSLGLKAHQILAAQRRLRAPGAPPPASIQD